MTEETTVVGIGADKLPYKLCEHIKDNGVRCGGSALRGKQYCRFHVRITEETLSPGDPGYSLPVLETEQSVQIALQQMMRGLLEGKLSERKAAIMLSGIKAAAQLLRQTGANVPKEDLLNEIAAELRGRMAFESSAGKPPQRVADFGDEEPAVVL